MQMRDLSENSTSTLTLFNNKPTQIQLKEIELLQLEHQELLNRCWTFYTTLFTLGINWGLTSSVYKPIDSALNFSHHYKTIKANFSLLANAQRNPVTIKEYCTLLDHFKDIASTQERERLRDSLMDVIYMIPNCSGEEIKLPYRGLYLDSFNYLFEVLKKNKHQCYKNIEYFFGEFGTYFNNISLVQYRTAASVLFLTVLPAERIMANYFVSQLSMRWSKGPTMAIQESSIKSKTHAKDLIDKLTDDNNKLKLIINRNENILILLILVTAFIILCQTIVGKNDYFPEFMIIALNLIFTYYMNGKTFDAELAKNKLILAQVIPNNVEVLLQITKGKFYKSSLITLSVTDKLNRLSNSQICQIIKDILIKHGLQVTLASKTSIAITFVENRFIQDSSIEMIRNEIQNALVSAQKDLPTPSSPSNDSKLPNYVETEFISTDEEETKHIKKGKSQHTSTEENKNDSNRNSTADIIFELTDEQKQSGFLFTNDTGSKAFLYFGKYESQLKAIFTDKSGKFQYSDHVIDNKFLTKRGTSNGTKPLRTSSRASNKIEFKFFNGERIFFEEGKNINIKTNSGNWSVPTFIPFDSGNK